jgi:acyl-CoA-binding protein
VSGSKPAIIFPLRRQIFEAWEQLKGMDQNVARQQYLDLALEYLKE